MFLNIFKCLALTGAMAVVGQGVTAQEESTEPANSKWYAAVDALALFRSTPGGGNISQSSPGGTPYLQASDFDFGVGAGLAATLGYRLSDTTSVETRILAASANATNQFVSPGSFIGPGFSGPGGTEFDTDYTTELLSGEINLVRKTSDRLEIFGGLRAIEITDTMNTVLDTTVARTVYVGQNSLFGAQAGINYRLSDATAPWQVSMSARAGLFANDSNGRVDLYFDAYTFGLSLGGQPSEATTVIAELGLTAERKLTNGMIVYAGYDLFWGNNLALASNAASESLFSPLLLEFGVYRDDLLLHGVSLGVRFEF